MRRMNPSDFSQDYISYMKIIWEILSERFWISSNDINMIMDDYREEAVEIDVNTRKDYLYLTDLLDIDRELREATNFLLSEMYCKDGRVHIVIKRWDW